MALRSPSIADEHVPLAVGGRPIDGPVAVVAFAVVVALAGLVFSQLVPFVVLSGLAALGVTLSTFDAVGVTIVLTEVVGFGLATWGFLRLTGKPADFVHVRTPTGRDLGWMLGGAVLVLVLYFGVIGAAVALGLPLARSGISVLGEGTPALLLLIAALSLVIVGPMEELFFRGVVQGTMREALPATPAIVLASATFASIHYLTLVGTVAGRVVPIASLFVTALVLGFAYERTRNLWVNAAIHGVYNAVLLVLAYAVFASGLAG